MPEQKYPPGSRPVPIGPDLSTVEKELARFFRTRYNPSPYEPPPPNVEPLSPKMFLNPPQNVVDLIMQYQHMFPGVMEGVKSVTSEIPRSSVQSAPPGWGVAGLYRPKYRDMFLNPGIFSNPYDLESTFAHELGHSVGYPHNRNLYNIEGLGGMRAEAKELWKKGVK